MPLTETERQQLQAIEAELENRAKGLPPGFKSMQPIDPPDPELLQEQERQESLQEKTQRLLPTLRETRFPEPPAFDPSQKRALSDVLAEKDRVLRENAPLALEAAGSIVAPMGIKGAGLMRDAARMLAAAAGGIGGREAGTRAFLGRDLTPGEIVESFLTEAGGEIAGTIFRQGRLVPGAEEAMQFFREQSPGRLASIPRLLRGEEIRSSPGIMGGIKGLPRTQLSPAQATENTILGFLENIVEASLFGQGRIRSLKRAQGEVGKRFASDLVGNLGRVLDDEAFGQFVQSNLRQSDRLFRRVASKAFEEPLERADELGLVVASGPLRKLVKELEQKLVPGAFEDEARRDLLEPQIRKAFQIVESFEDIPFRTADEVRKILGEISSDPGLTRRTRAVVGDLQDRLVKEMEKAARVADAPEIAEGLLKARGIFREGSKVFQDEFVEQVLKQKPSIAAKTIFDNPIPENIRVVRQAFKRMDRPELFQTFRANVLERAFREATDAQGNISGSALANMIDINSKRNKVAVFQQLFGTDPQGKTALSNFKKLANALRVAQAKEETTGGGIFIQFAQAGAVVNTAIKGVLEAASQAIILGPAVIGRLLLSPSGTKILTEGLLTKANTKKAAQMSAKLGAILAREGLLGEVRQVNPSQLPPIPSVTFKNVE